MAGGLTIAVESARAGEDVRALLAAALRVVGAGCIRRRAATGSTSRPTQRPEVTLLVARAAGVALGLRRLAVAGRRQRRGQEHVRRARGARPRHRAGDPRGDRGRPLRGRVTTLRLETGIKQDAAIRLYESAGFHRRGPFGSYRDDPLSVFMEKPL